MPSSPRIWSAAARSSIAGREAAHAPTTSTIRSSSDLVRGVPSDPTGLQRRVGARGDARHTEAIEHLALPPHERLGEVAHRAHDHVRGACDLAQLPLVDHDRVVGWLEAVLDIEPLHATIVVQSDLDAGAASGSGERATQRRLGVERLDLERARPCDEELRLSCTAIVRLVRSDVVGEERIGIGVTPRRQQRRGPCGSIGQGRRWADRIRRSELIAVGEHLQRLDACAVHVPVGDVRESDHPDPAIGQPAHVRAVARQPAAVADRHAEPLVDTDAQPDAVAARAHP